MYSILEGCHLNSCGGYFINDSTTHKALIGGYWWPRIFLDALQYVGCYDPCQRISCPIWTFAIQLVPILAQAPFEKWSIDFEGPIVLTLHNR